MSDTTTTNLGLTKPEVGVEDPNTEWGAKLNTNLDTIDDILDAVTPTTIASGDTASPGSNVNSAARADHVHGAPSIAAHNHARNPGLEIWKEATSFTDPADAVTVADFWAVSKTGTPTVDVSRNSTSAHVDTGLYSCLLNITAVGAGGPRIALKQTFNNYAEYRGKSLSLRVRVKTSLTNVKAQITDSAGSSQSSAHAGDGAYANLTVTKTINSSTTSLSIEIGYVDADITGTGAVYVDSVMLVIGSSTQAFEVTPEFYQSDLFPPGSVSLPAIAFKSDPNTGLYSSGADILDIATAGVQRVSVPATGGLKIITVAPATPVANTIYKDSIVSAWADISQAGGAFALDNDFNVGSITDNGTGDVTVTFATAMASNSYGVGLACQYHVSGISISYASKTTAAIRLNTTDFAANLVDRNVLINVICSVNHT